MKKAKDTKQLLQIWNEMKEHAFLSYRIEEEMEDREMRWKKIFE